MMSIGLKNADATYQRAIQACFKKQLNKNFETYVYNVVIKTRNSDTLIADLEETFASLREYQWNLNPNKCVFGVPSGKLLGFIINHRGIKANLENLRHHQHESSHLRQRCSEAHWVYGGLLQIHLKARRTGVTLLQDT
jgi:hypothetical protein